MGRELSPSSVACPFGTIGASLAPSAQGAVDALAGEFDPLALIDALARHEIDYVIVSGIAAMHHGATRRGAGGPRSATERSGANYDWAHLAEDSS